MFSESCKSISNLDCNYYFPIDFAHKRNTVCVPNQSEKGNYNPNLIWINKNQKNVLCVYYKDGLFTDRLRYFCSAYYNE